MPSISTAYLYSRTHSYSHHLYSPSLLKPHVSSLRMLFCEQLMDLSIWTDSAVVNAVPPIAAAEAAGIAHGKSLAQGGDDDGRWRVTVERQLPASTSTSTTSASASTSASACVETITLHPAHLVFATGNSGQPRVPSLQGAATFTGAQIHSSEYEGGARFAGKRCVVLGCNTSAHDIVQDLWEQGAASATMVQRSAGLVVSTESLLTHAVRDTGSEPPGPTSNPSLSTPPRNVSSERVSSPSLLTIPM